MPCAVMAKEDAVTPAKREERGRGATKGTKRKRKRKRRRAKGMKLGMKMKNQADRYGP